MNQSTERRLFSYAWQFKRGIILGIVFLIIATALELAGPFIAETIIDNHILGIESVWYEVDEATNDANIQYDNKYYVREDRLENAATENAAITILAIARHYYAVNGVAPLTGSREFENGRMTISLDDEPVEFAASKLSVQQLYQ